MRELILDALFWGSISHLPHDIPAEAIYWRIEKSFRLIEPRRLFHNLSIFVRRYPQDAVQIPFCFVQELLFFCNTLDMLMDQSYLKLCAALFGAKVEGVDLEIKGDKLFAPCYRFISNAMNPRGTEDFLAFNPHLRWFVESTLEKSSMSDSWDLDTCDVDKSNWRYMYKRWKEMSQRSPKYVLHVLKKVKISPDVAHIFHNLYLRVSKTKS